MAECSVRILPDPAIALVMARHGASAAAARAAERAFGVPLPMEPRIVYGEEIALLWSGPARWLVLAPDDQAQSEGGIEALLAPVFAGTASVFEQSGSRVLFEVSGEGAAEALARALPVDLHPGVFAPGHTALCRANYVPLQVWRAGVGATFVLAVPRSYAAGVSQMLSMAILPREAPG